VPTVANVAQYREGSTYAKYAIYIVYCASDSIATGPGEGLLGVRALRPRSAVILVGNNKRTRSLWTFRPARIKLVHAVELHLAVEVVPCLASLENQPSHLAPSERFQLLSPSGLAHEKHDSVAELATLRRSMNEPFGECSRTSLGFCAGKATSVVSNEDTRRCAFPRQSC
jgi:hypothetical protein